MVKFLKVQKKYDTRDADYVFESLKELKSVLPYLYTKIQGTWKIYMIDITIDEARELEKIKLPDFVNIECYLKADVLIKFLNENPKYEIALKKNYDKYLDLLSNYPKGIDRNASRELYSRCNGNTPKIEEALEELLTIAKDEDTITLKHINATILKEDIVYANEVILSALLKNNKLISKEDFKYYRYKFSDTISLYLKLEKNIGSEFAFYSMRKYMRKLYEEKNAYLENKEYKLDIVNKVDIYTIAHAYTCFELSNSHKQSIVILTEIERRNINDSNFRRTFITNCN